MNARELIEALTKLDADLPVMIRTGNGQLTSIDAATTERDTFETRIEIS
jgi:hypothetical protein